MPNRYHSSAIIPNSKKTESDGNVVRVRRLSSLLYPDFRNNKDVQILSQQGDRLDILAKEYYGDESLWYIIARVNNLGKGTLNVPHGIILRIPFYDEYTGLAAILNVFNDER